MNLANEAAYLYVHSKELLALNKKLQRLSKKAGKHVKKHAKAKTEEKKEKHKMKHSKTTENIAKLIKKHNKILEHLRAHQIAFAHALKTEHNV